MNRVEAAVRRSISNEVMPPGSKKRSADERLSPAIQDGTTTIS